MANARRKTKTIKNNPKDRNQKNHDPRNKNPSEQGFLLSEMIEMIEKESYASDISDDCRRRLIFLHGFLYNIVPPEEDRNTNIASAVEICRRIKLKYSKPVSDKIN